MREGAKANLGSVTELLDLTPYQLLRLLGAKPKAPAVPGAAVRRLASFLGDH